MLVSSFNLNYLSLSLYLQACRFKLYPHENKLNRMCVDATD